MTPGVLEIAWGSKVEAASMSPEGWQCADAQLQQQLTITYPPPSSGAGFPWITAFYEAARDLAATVAQEPEPDPWPEAVQ